MSIHDLARAIVHLTLRTRQFNNKNISGFARSVRNQKILEIGSGKLVDGKDVYSARRFFDSTNEFEQTDIDPRFGHRVLDVTKMQCSDEYDVIICMSVLEHVFDYQQAIRNLHTALKPEGTLLVSLPVFYPIHDEPHDYWRFTEHAIRRIFSQFGDLRLITRGLRQYPFAYFITAKKRTATVDSSSS